MERKKTIQELISALKTLRLQEANLTTQLEEAIAEQVGHTTNEKTERRSVSNWNLASGDRIRIKNKIHKPANWDNNVQWLEKEAKTATVTEVLTKGTTVQVHFVTDNGVQTWRAPNNVCLLISSTHQDE
jgi:hypothetical protein